MAAAIGTKGITGSGSPGITAIVAIAGFRDTMCAGAVTIPGGRGFISGITASGIKPGPLLSGFGLRQ